MALNKKGEITLIVLTVIMFVAAIVTPIIAVLFLRDSVEKQVVLGDYVLRYKKVNGKETYTIMEYRGEERVIVIPETMDGISVVGIGANAFSAASNSLNQNITSITLPDSITTIGKAAFKGLKNLVTLRIPKNVPVLESDVLASCSSLQSLTLPTNIEFKEGCLKDVTSLQDLTIIGSSTSSYLGKGMVETLMQLLPVSHLNVLQIGEGIVRVDENAFSSISIESFTIDEIVMQDVRYIESGAFKNVKIQRLQLSDCIESIGLSAFYGTQIETLGFYTTSQNMGSLNFNALSSASVKNIYIYGSSNNDGVFRLNIGGLMTEVESVFVDDSVKKVEGSVFGVGGTQYIKEFNYNATTTEVEFTSNAKIDVLHLRGTGTLTNLPKVYDVKQVYIDESYTGIDFSAIKHSYECLYIPLSLISFENEMPEGVSIAKVVFYAQTPQIMKAKYVADMAKLLKAAESLEFGSGIVGITNGTSEMPTFAPLFAVNQEDVKLQTIIFGEDFTTLGDYSFGGTTEAGLYVGMTNLKKVVFSNALKTIGVGVFAGCENAKFYDERDDYTQVEIILPNLTSVGAYAFANCYGLNAKHINLGQNNAVSMQEGALANVQLGTLTINTFTVLKDVKMNTSGVVKILVESSIKTEFDLANIADFITNLSNHSVILELCDGIGKIVDTSENNVLKNSGITVILPNSVYQIGSGVFANFAGALTYDFTNASIIGSRAFENCATLKMVHFSDALTSVGEGAFTENLQYILVESGDKKELLKLSGLQNIFVKATENQPEWNGYTWEVLQGTNLYTNTENEDILRLGDNAENAVYYVNNHL